MNVPKLRFKEFKDEWSTIELSKISSEISYGMGLPSKEYDGINKYIRITDIDENTSKYTNKDIVSPDGELEDKYIVKKNDILFARTGASTGKTYLYDKKDGKLYYAGFLIKANIINHDANFIFQQTHTSKYNKWIKVMSMRSGQPGINSQEYGSYKFSITSKTEEYKISKTLQLLDKKIELQTKKIEDLKLFKLYTKNQIFKDYDEIFKLKDILVKWNKKNKNNSVKYVESISNKYGFISQSDQFEDRNVASKDLSNYYIIEKGVFGYNPSRLNVGSLALKTNDKVSVVSPLYECFTTSQNNQYLLEWFDSKYFRKETISKFEGGVRNTLNFSNLCEIKIGLPTIEKQNKYSRIFKIFNNKIEFEVKKLYKLQELKKGLMQSMFV